MGKRSDFERVERDFYKTPREAIPPLIPHLRATRYAEPCAGDGALIRHLAEYDVECLWASDIEPQDQDIKKSDVMDVDYRPPMYITNPPWERRLKGDDGKILPADKQPLHMIINHLRNLAPTWLLFDADWAYTKQARPYMVYCHKVVAVGRLRWIEGSKHTGKDNCAWYLFDNTPAETIFIPRI